MKKRPRTNRHLYKNLFRRGGVIVYERVVNGVRVKLSTGTDDWDKAAEWKQTQESENGISRYPVVRTPTFEEAAEKVREALHHLAPTTKDDYEAMLAEEGPLVERFGALPLHAIKLAQMLDWWRDFVEEGKQLADGSRSPRSPKTGAKYVDALAAVFRWAEEREIVEARDNPVTALRAALRQRNRTKRGRAESEAGATVNPIEKLEEVASLVAAAAAEGGANYLVTLLCLDAGLRLGEATAIMWEDIEWDRRVLRVRRSYSRDKHLGVPKSGRSRAVAASRRLLAALRKAWLAAGRPESGFIARIDHANYRNRVLPRMLKAAKITGDYTPHNLRDTFASQLLTAGVQLGYISRQLGHGGVAITSRHYLQWCGGDDYRPAVALAPGEVPADLLARASVAESHQSPTTSDVAEATQ